MTLIESLCHVVQILDRIGVPYVVGGSYASSAWGHIRTTQDVDVVIQINADQLEELIESLEWPFFADQDNLRSIVDYPAEFDGGQITNGDTGDRVDLFLVQEDEYARSQFSRAIRAEALPGQMVNVSSAEDCILAKLRWYELANRISDRQWNDVLGILEQQNGNLDLEYLQRWGAHFGVEQLLRDAQSQGI